MKVIKLFGILSIMISFALNCEATLPTFCGGYDPSIQEDRETYMILRDQGIVYKEVPGIEAVYMSNGSDRLVSVVDVYGHQYVYDTVLDCVIHTVPCHTCEWIQKYNHRYTNKPFYIYPLEMLAEANRNRIFDVYGIRLDRRPMPVYPRSHKTVIYGERTLNEIENYNYPNTGF